MLRGQDIEHLFSAYLPVPLVKYYCPLDHQVIVAVSSLPLSCPFALPNKRQLEMPLQ